MAEQTRRTQAERSLTTRQALLKATVKCLFEHGYGATTTIMVAKEAGLSRGAMLHQFPTKADLMTFVVETDFEEELTLYSKLLDGIDQPRERLVAYPKATWEILSRPSGVAVLEILQGSRSDADLREKLAPVQARIQEQVDRTLKQEFRRGHSMPLLQLIVGAARGLSIAQVLAPEGEDMVDAIVLLQNLLRAGVETGLISKQNGAEKASKATEPRASRPVREEKTREVTSKTSQARPTARSKVKASTATETRVNAKREKAVRKTD